MSSEPRIPKVAVVDVASGREPLRRRWRSVAVAAAVLVPAAAWNFAATAGVVPPTAPAVPAVGSPIAGAASYAPVVDSVAPAVVTIRTEHAATVRRTGAPDTDDLFREFFGDRFPGQSPRAPRAEGLGSGVIVRSDGYILTNHHVVDGAARVRVELTDGRSFAATVIGSDAPSDLAVLKVDDTGLPSVTLGDSDAVRVGDVVLALGNPMGVGQTVTMGIISAKGRATGLGDGSFEDFLQTDAPINRGNSGGALVSSTGQLIGINSQILSPSGGNIGIGFAIPSNMAKHVLQSLIADGQVHRGMLGVTVQPVTSELARSLGLESTRGALVSSVTEDGPAEKAGVKRGDVITRVDGVPVQNSNDVRNRIAATKPGSTVALRVTRNGREQDIQARVAELPSQGRVARTAADEQEGGQLGLALAPLPAERSRELGLEPGEGLVVSNVSSGSPADAAGFQRGDVIEEVNGSVPRSPDDVRKAVPASGDTPALVLVRRGEQSLYLPLSPRA